MSSHGKRLLGIQKSCDFVLELLSTYSITAMHLSRLGEQGVLRASQEFSFITPSDSVSTRSSIMPHKINPDPMELVSGKSARVIGDLMTLLTLCKGLPLAYNCDLQEDKEPIVHKGLPFRTGHDVVGRAVALRVYNSCQLHDLSLDEFRTINPVFDESVYDYLGVENCNTPILTNIAAEANITS
nr:argininosuccinate lyase, chloroplastic [Tanacetum cinerariifolium]